MPFEYTPHKSKNKKPPKNMGLLVRFITTFGCPCVAWHVALARFGPKFPFPSLTRPATAVALENSGLG